MLAAHHNHLGMHGICCRWSSSMAACQCLPQLATLSQNTSSLRATAPHLTRSRCRGLPVREAQRGSTGGGSNCLRTSTGFLRTLPLLLKKPFRKSGPPPVSLTKETFLRTLPLFLRTFPLFLRTLLLFLRASTHLPDSHRVSLILRAWSSEIAKPRV